MLGDHFKKTVVKMNSRLSALMMWQAVINQKLSISLQGPFHKLEAEGGKRIRSVLTSLIPIRIFMTRSL